MNKRLIKSALADVVTTQQAAKILDCSQGRVRQLVIPDRHGQIALWSCHVGSVLLLQRTEVEKHAAKMRQLRRDGKVRGAAPKGYKRDRSSTYYKRKVSK